MSANRMARCFGWFRCRVWMLLQRTTTPTGAHSSRVYTHRRISRHALFGEQNVCSVPAAHRVFCPALGMPSRELQVAHRFLGVMIAVCSLGRSCYLLARRQLCVCVCVCGVWPPATPAWLRRVHHPRAHLLAGSACRTTTWTRCLT